MVAALSLVGGNRANCDVINKMVFAEGMTVVAQAIQFFLAGFETTGSTISFTLYEMAMNMDIQRKLRAEISVILKKHGAFTYEALQDMKFLDQCVSGTVFFSLIPMTCL